MDFLELMRSRYTTKHYDKTKPVSNADFAKILEALRLTPSSVNLQPWHFFVANTEEGKALIRPAILDFNLPRFDDCSHILVIASRMVVTERDFKQVLDQEEQDGRLPTAELKAQQDQGRKRFTLMHNREMAAWSGKQAYIALGTALYAAASLGIDTTAIEGADFTMLDRILNLPEQGLTSQVVVSFGHRALNDSNHISVRPKSRLKLEDLVTYL